MVVSILDVEVLFDVMPSKLVDVFLCTHAGYRFNYRHQSKEKLVPIVLAISVKLVVCFLYAASALLCYALLNDQKLTFGRVIGGQ